MGEGNSLPNEGARGVDAGCDEGGRAGRRNKNVAASARVVVSEVVLCEGSDFTKLDRRHGDAGGRRAVGGTDAPEAGLGTRWPAQHGTRDIEGWRLRRQWVGRRWGRRKAGLGGVAAEVAQE